MYCSACGVAVISGLSYCNHCGARLRDSSVATAGNNQVKPSETFSESLVWAMVAVFVVGIGCLIGLMAVMKEVLNFDVPIILSVLAVSFFLIFLLEGVFIWLLLSSRRAASQNAANVEGGIKQVTAADLDTNELYAPPAGLRSLPESQGVPSVVEHTTKSLEPVPVERKPK